MEIREEVLQEIIREKDLDMREKVIHDMAEAWEKGEMWNYFPLFVDEQACYYWLRRASQN